MSDGTIPAMTQIPAGWYPDPAEPGGYAQRYWDGRQWTEHVHAAAPLVPPHALPDRATTPDGQALAGWWHRVGAYLIDQLIWVVLTMLIGLPMVIRVARAYIDYVGSLPPGTVQGLTVPPSLAAQSASSTMLLGLIGLVVGFVYNVGFLKWRQATPGKLLVGLRVRRRDVAGPMPWSTVLLRWAGQFWGSLLFLVPVVGTVVGFYPLLDDLWPLWDDKRQAVHDKAAGTNVVRA
jgi:uncharacterized RDD family membrane protein YckC